MELNAAQKQAVGHFKGPALVLAGPGSGKTAVITRRVQYLIDHYQIDPSKILVITFTKAAAVEMKERYLRICQKERTNVTFGTFHAVFFTILRHAYHYTADQIVREEQRFAFMREIVQKQRLEYEDETDFITSVLGEISLVKNTGISLEHYYSKNCGDEIFRKIYAQYQQKLYENHLIDFDDMLVYCYELFCERKDILAAWQKKFEYILIDEFQDINKLQFDVIKMLAESKQNLFVVGDDDQSIYRFRGARPEIMLNFERDFPNTAKILLDVNYRSRQRIIAAAQAVIGKNENRFKKQIQAYRQEQGRVTAQIFKNQWEENQSVIASILHYNKCGVPYEEMAILFRTNTQPRILMEQLMEYNIPFKTRDSIPNLYDHWVVQDIFAYFRLAYGSRKRKDVLQIMNRPKRYISRESLMEEEVAFDVWHDYFESIEQSWVAERIEKLEYDLKILSRITPYAAINYIRKGIGYEDYLMEYAQYRKIKVEDLIDVLEELQDGAKDYKTYAEWMHHIEVYTQERKEQAKQQQQNMQSVSLATLHSAKGLEYSVVYIVDVNEKMMPYKKAVLEKEMEEERRLFYVGMTRAKDALHLCAVQKLNGHEVELSRFLEESRIPIRGYTD